MKHKHYDMIVAWASGKDIQFKVFSDSVWEDVDMNGEEWYEDYAYRIKPEPKPDVVRNITVEATARCGEEFVQVFKSGKYCFPNLHLTFDGETGRLKSAEVL